MHPHPPPSPNEVLDRLEGPVIPQGSDRVYPSNYPGLRELRMVSHCQPRGITPCTMTHKHDLSPVSCCIPWWGATCGPSEEVYYLCKVCLAEESSLSCDWPVHSSGPTPTRLCSRGRIQTEYRALLATRRRTVCEHVLPEGPFHTSACTSGRTLSHSALQSVCTERNFGGTASQET